MTETGVPGIEHETDERLELYALNRMTELEVAAVEEHLLICHACQTRLDEVETFALAMRDAISSEPAEEAPRARFNWFQFGKPALAWAGSIAAIVAAAVFFMLQPNRTNLVPLATLQLTAIRGEVTSVLPARETDINLADAPASSGLRIEVVDGTGRTIWNGIQEGDDHQVKLLKPLSDGSYFVRLYGVDGTLLHEYGFQVRSPL